MTFPGRAMVQGTFTVPSTVTSSVAAVVNVNCGFQPSKVELLDITPLVAEGTAGGNLQSIYRSVWNSTMNATTMLEWLTASNSTSVYTSNTTIIASNGISVYNGGAASPNEYALAAGINGSNIAKATGTFTVTSTATLYPGATVLVTNRGTGASSLSQVNPSLGGMFFTINTIASSTTFTIANGGWMNTALFTDGAQTFSVFLVTTPELYYPKNAQIVNISSASSAVVTTSTNTNLTVGQKVRLLVPSYFGMTQMNNLIGQVTAVTTNQVTLNINSSAFTAFAWNTGGAAGVTSIPYVQAILIPIGAGPTVQSGPPTVTYNVDQIDDATDSQAFQGFTVGSSILIGSTNTTLGVTAGDTIHWTAWRQDA